MDKRLILVSVLLTLLILSFLQFSGFLYNDLIRIILLIICFIIILIGTTDVLIYSFISFILVYIILETEVSNIFKVLINHGISVILTLFIALLLIIILTLIFGYVFIKFKKYILSK